MAGNTERFQKAMNQGHSAAWDQMWGNAASFYRQALDEFPDNPKALTSLGLALYELQDFDEALTYYRHAAEVSPNDPLPKEKVAELCERTGDLEKAIDLYMEVAEQYIKSRDANKAIELWSHVASLRPSHLLAHSRLALVYEHLGRKSQAMVEYLAVASLLQHIGEVAKSLQALGHISQFMPESREVKQAISLVKGGRLLPKPVRPRGTTGPLLMEQVRQLEAPQSDEEVTDLDPIAETRQKALTILAGMLFEQGEDVDLPQESKRDIRSIMRGGGAANPSQVDRTKIILHLSQAVDLQARKQSSQAAEELERAIEAGLDHPAASFDMGLMLFEGENLDRASNYLQRAVNNPGFALGSHLLLGKIYYQIGKPKNAAIELLEALRIADTQIVAQDEAEELSQLYEPVIEAQSQETEPEKHTRLCDNILDLLVRPGWRSHLGQARQQLPVQGKGSAPMPLAEILTEARSSQVVESLTQIHQLARAGKFRTAMEEAFQAIQFAPTYLPLHVYMGDILLQQEHIQEAIEKYKVVARSYAIRSDVGRSISLYRRIVDISPMDMEVRSQLIDTLIARSQMDDAINEYMRLADVYYNMADLNSARQTYTQALRLAQQGNVDRSWRVKVLHQMADIDLQSLDWRQALRVFEQIRTLEPDDEKARTTIIDLYLKLGQENQSMAEMANFIAYLVDTGKQTKALTFLEQLVEEYPKQPLIHRQLAEVYRLMGRVQDAIQQLDIAGESFIEAGEKSRAVESIMAILAMNPPNAADYEQLLSRLKGS